MRPCSSNCGGPCAIVFFFSGLEWQATANGVFGGYCGFLRAKGPSQYILGPPFVAVVVAKSASIRSGLGQSISATYAAQLANQQARTAVTTIYGIVSTGRDWKFLRLQGKVVTIDILEYYIANLPKLMGILREIVQTT